MRTHLLPAAGLLVAALAFAAPAPTPQIGLAAPGTSGGVSVNAAGAAKLAPDSIRIHFKVKGTAESPKAAFDEFRAKRTLFDKMAAGYPEIEIASGGIEIGKPAPNRNQVFMNGQQPAATFEAREDIYARIPIATAGDEAEEGAPARVSSPEGIAGFIEAAIEVEAQLGEQSDQVYYTTNLNDRNPPDGPVLYEASKDAIAAARSTAIENAMADARQQATELANASGRKLGRVQNVSVSSPFHGASLGRGTTERTVQLNVSFVFED